MANFFLWRKMKVYLVSLCSLIFLLSGCSTKEPLPRQQQTPVLIKDELPKRKEIVSNALKHKDKRDGGDCSGFVSLVNKESGFPYFETKELNEHFEDARRSLAIYNLLESQKRLHWEKPLIGDLIFFANTVKKYAKGKSVDNITHIGIVTKIDADETVHFLHHTRGKNVMGYMNLTKPTLALQEGKMLNSYMEKCSISQSYECLAPTYFSAYGTIK
jgi:hypothetical protein